MAIIHNNGVDNYELMEEIIENYDLDGKEVLQLLTDYHGCQLLSYDFMDNLIDCEGYDV